MPDVAYSNPTTYGGDDFWNRLVFALSHIFVDQKMMALFSMLFGASVLLVTRSIEKRGESPFKFYYLRNFWLLIIGLLHSVLLWSGDILVIYALCSFVLYWFRKMRPLWQLTVGLIIFFVPSLFNVWAQGAIDWRDSAEIQPLVDSWQPSADYLASDIEYYRGDYLTQVTDRHRLYQSIATGIIFTSTGVENANS